MKRNHKKYSSKWIMLVIYMIAGACTSICARGVTSQFYSGDGDASVYFGMLILLLIFLYLVLFFHIIIHEMGHMIFGLLTGYTFSSFRIGSLLWMKEDGKIKLKRYTIPGSAGQCLMRPPKQVKGQFPVILYNLGGSILNFLFSILFLIIWLSTEVKVNPMLCYFCILMVFIGFAIALSNGIPMSTPLLDNDGKNAMCLSQNNRARQAFWIQLEINHLLTTGTPLTDMQQDWFLKPSEEGMQNNMIATMAVFRCNYLMEKMRFSEAKDEMLALVNGDYPISGLNKALLIHDIIYCELIDGCNKRNIDLLLTGKQREVAKSMKTNPGIIRTEYVYALIYEKNLKKANKIKRKFEKVAKTYPYQVTITAERKLMAYADEVVNQYEINKTI